jgi:hypothetical protein
MHRIPVVALALLFGAASFAQAEIRHVEIKTLGMD